jgi:hypothetical protein
MAPQVTPDSSQGIDNGCFLLDVFDKLKEGHLAGF